MKFKLDLIVDWDYVSNPHKIAPLEICRRKFI